MIRRPLLTFFARTREDFVPQIKLYYNEELEMNLPVGTQDIPNEITCGTRTITEVKTEGTDKDENDDFSVFYSTETFTKVKAEEPDKDVSE